MAAEAQRLVAALHAEVHAAEQDGSIADRASEFVRELRELGGRVDTWTPALAETFSTTAGLLWIGGFYGLRDLLGTEASTALHAALGITTDYTPPCTTPGARNAFTGNGSSEQIRNFNNGLTLRFRVTQARRPRQRGSHLSGSRQREGRGASPRRRGSRRSAGARAGPSDDGGGDPEPGERALDRKRRGR